MTRNRTELAELVQRLITEKAEERRKALWEERRQSGDFIVEVHEADISIDPSTFKIVSETKTEDGDTLIDWEVVEYVLTEFTVNEPHRFERSGTLLLKKDGRAELM